MIKIKKTLLRLDKLLYEDIKKKAKLNNQSINKFIEKELKNNIYKNQKNKNEEIIITNSIEKILLNEIKILELMKEKI